MNWRYDANIAGFQDSALAPYGHLAPWEFGGDSVEIIREILAGLDPCGLRGDEIWVGPSSTIEDGAVLKGPLVIGPDCFIAAGAYLRGGCWLEGGNTIGPGCELKSSFVFSGAKLAHFNFVGDSVIGHDVNLEAGAIIANFRNENDGQPILIRHGSSWIETNAMKFGALVGDRTKIGANAVIAPGAIIAAGTVISRLALIDQSV